ncbi:MAG: SpoIID/LytB domain-containing protein [Candidatus Abawacabacteria bacterium]|nr:SpoIID/LytB domain-containing protein [Candidatus Abawacabacteria bacterium]
MLLLRKIALIALVALLLGDNFSSFLITDNLLRTIIQPSYAASELLPFNDQVLTIPAQEENATYISNWFSVQAFYGLQLTWQATSAQSVIFSYRTQLNAQWEPFVQDVDSVDGIALPVFTKMSEQIQIKADLRKDANQVPAISSVRLSLVDPGKSALAISSAQADEAVITRTTWGADESLRLRTTRDRIRTEQAKKKPVELAKPDPIPATPKSDEPKKPTEESEYGPNCSKLEAKYPQELKVVSVSRNNPAGEEYTWPVAYAAKLRKLVVHHTDMDIKDYDQNGVIDNDDYKAAVRAIYYFHTISRDWGDIGYNYLIDPAGHIYEGRAGGDMAIAAHTLCKNNGALGIALLGRFQDSYPSEAALVSLQSLLKAKSKEYGIDPQGQSMFYGSLLPNIIGHRDARATSCPGERLYGLLPSLRDGNLTDTTKITFPTTTVSESRTYSPPQPLPTIQETKKVYKASPLLMSQVAPAVPGEILTLNIHFRNEGNTVWNSDTMVRPTFLPTGLTLIKQAKQNEDLVSPDGTATFLPQFMVDQSLAKSKATVELYVVPNGMVDLSSYKTKVDIVIGAVPVNQDISLNGVSAPDQVKAALKKNLVAAQVKRSTDSFSRFIIQDIGGEPVTETTPNVVPSKIRVKLSVPDAAVIAQANNSYQLIIDESMKHAGVSSEEITISAELQGLMAKVGTNVYHGKVVRLVPLGDNPIVTLVNFKHSPEWNLNLNDNQYRGIMEWRIISGKLTTINELPLEEYLQGLAEVSNSAPMEKQKVMAIIARSYASFYLIKDKKFPGLPYDLDDNPNVSQKYLGYGYEKRSPAFVEAVHVTKGQVLKYQGEVVKTPYFSKSDGRTRSAEEVWGWTHTPYLSSVPDPLCQNPEGKLSGHGVGLSGCGAEEAAKRGYTAAQILQYYYPGTEMGEI